MSGHRSSLFDRLQPGGEICAAALLILTVPLTGIHGFTLLSGGTDRIAGLVFFSVASGVLVWIGGRKLWRFGLWILAIRLAGAVVLSLGMITLITGYHTEFAPCKVWRKTPRDSDLDLIIIGAIAVGLSFLLESIISTMRSKEDSPTRRYRQPR